ncbi:MAG: sugar transferase [Syntrophomonadaceae bacterium]|nr:sugar transferase [Syntrophomonadaceae bacterium]
MLQSSFKLSALTTLLVTFYAFFFHYYEFPRFVIALASILMFFALTLWSVLFLKISIKVYPKGYMLIVAKDKEDAQKLYAKARHETKRMHLDYIGWVADDDFTLVSHKMRTATDILVSMNVCDERKTQIMLFCAEKRKTVYIVPQFYELSYASFRIIQFYDTPTFMVDNMGLTFQQRLFKRTFDIVFSVLALLITLPLQLIIPIAIKLDSKGPIFYSQERNTINSRIYDVLKYRTMVHNAEHLYGAYQAQEDDPRLTRVGQFLRNTHLDELPQFFNVLRGDMSVVGPRSDRPITINEFEQRIPGYDQRLKVKSGITGLAQIMGKYNTDPEDKLRYDMIYIKNYSLLMDFKIAFLTLGSFLPKNQYSLEKTSSDYVVSLADDVDPAETKTS